MYFNLGFYRSKSNDNLSFTKAVENANNAYSGENYHPILPTPPLLPNSSLKHKTIDEKIDEDREQNPRPYVAPDFLDQYDIMKI